MQAPQDDRGPLQSLIDCESTTCLIAFSSKGRAVCPSCNTRRMVATGAHLTDHVLPDLPVRQWVLPVPKRLRYFLERDADLQGAALRLLLRVVEQCLRAHSPGSGPAARLGAVAFIHRFGSSLNAHLHFHCVVIDGVFDATPTGGVVFHAATGLEANAIAQVQAQVRRRLARACSRAAACCQPMTRRRWGNGRMAAAFRSTARCASRPPTALGAGGCSREISTATSTVWSWPMAACGVGAAKQPYADRPSIFPRICNYDVKVNEQDLPNGVTLIRRV